MNLYRVMWTEQGEGARGKTTRVVVLEDYTQVEELLKNIRNNKSFDFIDMTVV